MCVIVNLVVLQADPRGEKLKTQDDKEGADQTQQKCTRTTRTAHEAASSSRSRMVHWR